jgi:hypothetical protein
MTEQDKKELENKILQGLKKSYEKLIEYKKQHNEQLVILQDNTITRIKL